MKFVKVSDSMLRCLITEEEMNNLGFGIDDLISNKEKAQDFLQIVLADAEAETGFKMNGTNALSVEATMLPGKGLSLTISGKDHIESVKDKIRRFHEAMSDYVQFLAEENTSQVEEVDTDRQNLLIVRFEDMRSAIEYCRVSILEEAASSIYKMPDTNCYFLILEKEFTNEDLRFLGGAALEYAEGLDRNELVESYIEENGQCIISGNAVESLKAVSA